MRSHRQAILVASALILGLAVFADGKKGGGGGGGKNGGSNGNGGGASNYSGPTSNPSAGAVMSAQRDLNAVVARLKAAFEASDDWKNAQQAVQDAKAAQDTASKPVLSALADTADYRTAVANRDAAVKALDDARAQGDASDDQITQLVSASFDARQAVTKMQNDALTADARVTDAKAKVQAANDALQKLRQQFTDSMKNDPDWQTADKALTDARAQAAQASAKGG
jgi:hypothetical protein